MRLLHQLLETNLNVELSFVLQNYSAHKRCRETVHNHFMKHTLHVRKSVPDGVVLCELGRVPLQLYWQKMLLKYVSRISELPPDRLVKRLLLMPHL